MPGTATQTWTDGTPTNGADPWMDSLTWGGRWVDSDGGRVTISIAAVQDYSTLDWSPAELQALGQALALWESVANIDFVEVSSSQADVWFFQVTAAQLGGALGQSEIPGYAYEPLYVVFNGQASSWAPSGLGRGGLGFVTLVHEIGHLLGLAHPHDGGSEWDRTTFPGVDAPFNDYGDYGLNQGIYTTMSYNAGWPALPGYTSEVYGAQAGPMALDIAAIQAIYGANTTYASGNNTYGLPTANAPGTYWSCIWDTGGVDTISNAGGFGDCIINLNPATAGSGGGGYVSYGLTTSGTIIAGGYTIARGVVIENATGGAGRDTLIGNSSDNVLDGGAGNDKMSGGLGNDTYVADSAQDLVTEGTNEGTDTVQASISWTLGANIEQLRLTGTGSIDGTGNGLANSLFGNAGKNVLDGLVGADKMSGGAGDDTYVVDNAGDTALEVANEGTDLVRASVSFKLGANLENLALTGADHTDGTGNELQNALTGNAGNNIFDGGAGADTMAGGLGDDIYVVDNAGDVVTEGAGGGVETIQSSVTYMLGANVEKLVLTGADHLNGTGNELANTLWGNAGNNVLDGGAGADTMAGGLGNDTYILDNTADVVSEGANAGIDTIWSAFSFALGANIEKLTLIGGNNINGTGNELLNTLTGNAGKNVLNGGLGADIMIGGAGDDTYVVDGGDTVIEVAGQGIDTIYSSASFKLEANLENLVLTGTGHVNGTGNELTNILSGNAGNNVLDGGAGADAMAGGAGDDTYILDSVADVVSEGITAGIDTIWSTFSFVLGANVEKLTLTGGNNIDGTGNELGNTLTGNAGKNVLNGGLGADTMIGGAGDDTYVVDGADIVIEAAGQGTDTIQSSASCKLGANLENLVLTGAGHVDGSGNDLTNMLTGNAGNNFLDGGAGADTMAGGAGNDTYVVDNAGDVVTEGTGGGTETVQSSVTYMLSANVENLVLAGAGHVNGSGNDLKNALTGNAGNNILDGGAGADAMAGGLGHDTYVVDDAGDTVSEAANEGTDTVKASFSFVLGVNVENLALVGTGHINGTGNGLANTLTGNAGKNVLNGGLGADTMIGGAGDDTYVVDAADIVVEAVGQGIDMVQSSASFKLGANLEALVLTGAGHVNGTGNELANSLSGNAGNNVLDGGAGADAMSGGLGNDTYVVDNAGDVVTEGVGGGTETVQSSVTYSLGANLENLLLTGAGHLNGTGNELMNLLTGNAGNNVLDGRGGADAMAGGAGNDTYVVDDADDTVSEAVDKGTDTVKASISFVLGANVENLTLGGTGHINGTGNGLANTLTGNAGRNVLNGGLGADTMIGGAGDDTYVVDAADIIVEAAGQGTDTVQSSVSFKLGANVENLALTGAGHVNGTGNELKNMLTGNTGNNVLNGGAGADTMAGGLGNDTYFVDNAGDVVTEAVGGGTETIESSITHTLVANVENLLLTGAGHLKGTGNDLKNVLTGNAGNNVLDGRGGADAMAGGLGNDTYVVDNAGDVVTEDANAGIDTIWSTFSFVLGANVEKLTLAGGNNIDGTGNELVNTLTGNAGKNVLNGGLGADTMIGGSGNDTYVVDGADIVVEAADQGTDTVQSSASFKLGRNLENLVLMGTGHVDGTGNELKNMLTGNAGNNVLNGGAGTDTMTGGAGNDTYVVDVAGDIVVEAVYKGLDTVRSAITYALTANVEDLVLTGTGHLDGTGNTLKNTLTGNAGNNVLDGRGGADAMAGGGGNDTYVVDNAGDAVTEAANMGADTVRASISFVLGANIENLILVGTGPTNGTGNGLANILTGNAGINILNGGAGADTMSGGAGNDIFVVDNAGDVSIEEVGQGVDTVQSSVTHKLRANIENLTLIGAADIGGTGNELANALTGNAGNNLLDGGAGVDTMAGGAGNDTYVVDVSGDLVVEAAYKGLDTVQSAVAYTLSANVENLILTGSANVSGTGNKLDNWLTGNAGANALAGGLGNDTYVVGAGDMVVELGGQGTDTVQASTSFVLGANVEDLILLGTGHFNGTGNELNNVLTGNAGNNILDGRGGADAMAGGKGNDTYLVDNAGDKVSEGASGGIDTVRASVSYGLAKNVENLVLTGTASINAAGNAMKNALTGNAGNNGLNGGGGADEMAGGAGNDTYYVDDMGDMVKEWAGSGTDSVYAWVSYALTANVENLTLSGTANINGQGNNLANSLSGNGGANVLDGGAGADTLNGGHGNDVYRFSTALGPANVDRIVAYDHAGDTIHLDRDIFAALAMGTLNAGAFNTGAVATQADDRVLFETTTKSLFYDADGLGGVAAVKFATIGSITGTLDYTDFFVV